MSTVSIQFIRYDLISIINILLLMLIFQIYAHSCQMIQYYLEGRRIGSTVTHVVLEKMRVFAQSVLELAI